LDGVRIADHTPEHGEEEYTSEDLKAPHLQEGGMKVTGFVLFGMLVLIYLHLVKEIWRLVAESKQLGSATRFNRFWWTPAWRLHRAAFPSSELRRGIVHRFIAITGLGIICFFLIVWADIHSLGWFGW
jgi:hypothetical protein